VSSPAAIKILSSPPLRSVLEELRPKIELSVGHPLHVEIGPAAELKQRLDDGSTFDVVILTPALIDALTKDGRVDPCTRISIARAGLGVVVRTGAKLDVSTVGAFRNKLLAAKSIVYASGSAVVRHIEQMLEQLHIANETRAKTRTLPAGGYIARAVAEGAAEVGLTTIPTILESRGVQLAGPFPQSLQSYVDLHGGVNPSSKQPEHAKELLQNLVTPEAIGVIRAKGLECFAGKV
jgi:molybdate transport system substrate-binding protein